jgi:hypothetical protein
MSYSSKLRWTNANILPYFGFGYLVTLILEDQLFATHYSTWIYGGVVIVWGISQSMRTRLAFYALIGILGGLCAWHYELATHMDTIFSLPTFIIHLVIIVAVLLLSGVQIFSQQEKLEANARGVFELTAENVSEIQDGFTNRPYAAGKAMFDDDELIAFARFMDSAGIVYSRIDSDNVALKFSMTASPLTHQDSDNISQVLFDRHGTLSVQIAQSDYRQYKEQLSFDQLCPGMAEVFKRFLHFYREGVESRIMAELQAQRH